MAKIETQMKIGWALLVVAALMAGCETSSLENQGEISLTELQSAATPTVTTPTTSGGGGTTTGGGTSGVNPGFPAAIDGPIHWLHTDVSRWAQTASLNASVGGMINMPYSKAGVWHAVDGLNANPWVIVKWRDGKWYAATFEWLRKGQQAKPKGVLNGSLGDHIKVAPLNQWRPHSGEKFYIMVSGLARTQMRNVQERSNASLVTWP